MIKIRNKLFQRKKRQPNNKIIRGYTIVIRELKNSPQKYYNEFFEVNSNNINKHGKVSDQSLIFKQI